VFVESIRSPRCSKCSEAMSLRIIEPEKPGFDLRTFECPKCRVIDTVVVPISREAEVSTAIAQSRIERNSAASITNTASCASRHVNGVFDPTTSVFRLELALSQKRDVA
jgi:hypothetical protein